MAKGMFLNTAGSIISILMLIGLMLAIIPLELIKDLLGNNSLFVSGFYGPIIGAVTIIPAFFAFPLASSLFESGANIVGIAALPIEIEHFGKRSGIKGKLISVFMGYILVVNFRS